MLVLTRKSGECIVFQDEAGTTVVLIRVSATDGGRVRVAIDAHQRFTVLREELLVEREQDTTLLASFRPSPELELA